jgi:uncharacterized membrane protein YhaH (DUF805 family)
MCDGEYESTYAPPYWENLARTKRARYWIIVGLILAAFCFIAGIANVIENPIAIPNVVFAFFWTMGLTILIFLDYYVGTE